MSSSSNTAANMSALVADLGSPPAQPLTRANYLPWKALVIPAFRGANIMGLIDGTDAAPSRTIEAEDSSKNKIQVPNPDYVTWIARDQLVMRWLLNSLSPDILSHVLRVDSTASAWIAINGMFTTASRTKAHNLRCALNDTKNLSMTAD
jgi:hypothetical protein